MDKELNPGDSRFSYLVGNYLHWNDQNKFVDIDKDGVKRIYAKDQDTLKDFICSSFEIDPDLIDF